MSLFTKIKDKFINFVSNNTSDTKNSTASNTQITSKPVSVYISEPTTGVSSTNNVSNLLSGNNTNNEDIGDKTAFNPIPWNNKNDLWKKQIFAEFNSILKQAGFEIKNNDDFEKYMRLIVGVSSFDEIKDLKPEQLIKVKQSLTHSIKKHQNDPNIDDKRRRFRIINDANNYIIEYFITNRTPEECDKEKDNFDIREKMSKTLGRDFSNKEITYEDLKEYYQKMNSTWNTVLRYGNQYRKGNFDYKDNGRMLRDFVKALRTTEDENLKKNLMLVISEVIVGNGKKDCERKLRGMEAVFLSLSDKAKMELAEDIHNKGLMKEILHIEPEKWEHLSQEEKEAYIRGLSENASHFSEEYAKKAPKTDEENRQKLIARRDELKAKTTLTKKEQAELDKIENQLNCNIAEQAATAYGITALNHNISDEAKIEIANAYSNNTDGEEIVRTIAGVAEIHELSAENEEKFTQIMDSATGGNYSIASNDLKNGTRTEFNTSNKTNNIAQENTSKPKATNKSSPDKSSTTSSDDKNIKNNTPVNNAVAPTTEELHTEQENSHSSYGMTFVLGKTLQINTDTKTINKTTSEEINSKPDTNNAPIGKTSKIAKIIKDFGINAALKVTSLANAIAITLTECKNNTSEVKNALNRYEQANTSTQRSVLHNANCGDIHILLENTSVATLDSLKGEKLNTYYSTKLLKEEIQESDEKRRKTEYHKN